MARQFDVASKHLIESRPLDWLKLAGFPVPALESDVSIVDADLSSVMTLAADKLIRVDHPAGASGPYLAHIEFQSGSDATLDSRVHMYNVVSRRRHGLPVWSAVFLLRPEAAHGNIKGRVVDRLDAVAAMDFSYHLIRVWELSTDLILNGGLGVLPLAPITAVEPDNLPPVIAAVNDRLANELPMQQGREFLLAMRLLMGLRYDDRLTERLMQSVFEMRESVEWQKIFRSGRDEGKVEGRAEGLKEGERDLLIRLATARFGPPSDAMLKKLQAIDSRSEIMELSIRFLEVSDWDALLKS